MTDQCREPRERQIRTLEGCFFCDVHDHIIGACIAADRWWEYFATEWVKTIVSRGDTVLDLGANLGWYTVVMARRVGNEGRVLAFEPEPRNFALLKKNVAWNDVAHCCSLYEIALWEHEGIQKLELSETNLGDHRIRIGSPSGQEVYGESARAEISVQCKPLDAVIASALPEDARIRLWKMDCQGSEVSILRGARQTLERTEYLLVEYWPYALARLGQSPDDFASSVEDYFDEFCPFQNGTLPFRPIGGLRDSLDIPFDPYKDVLYVFRKGADGLI